MKGVLLMKTLIRIIKSPAAIAFLLVILGGALISVQAHAEEEVVVHPTDEEIAGYLATLPQV